MERPYRFAPQSIAIMRTRLHIKQADLATALGVTKKQISDWEMGRSDPTAAMLAAIYSIGAEKGQTPEFFAPVKLENRPALPSAVSISAYWDMQNIAPSKKKALQRETVIKSALEDIAPGVTPGLYGFANPSQKAGFEKLTGWAVQTSGENWDERIISEIRKATKKSPTSKIVFLITGDTGYRALIKELLGRGAAVYLGVLPKVSQRLVSEVKAENVITLP